MDGTVGAVAAGISGPAYAGGSFGQLAQELETCPMRMWESGTKLARWRVRSDASSWVSHHAHGIPPLS
jgi:hypothetical protein